MPRNHLTACVSPTHGSITVSFMHGNFSTPCTSLFKRTLISCPKDGLMLSLNTSVGVSSSLDYCSLVLSSKLKVSLSSSLNKFTCIGKFFGNCKLTCPQIKYVHVQFGQIHCIYLIFSISFI